MDYKRIYADFIKDRRAKTPGYPTERHHITPRHMGGTDAPDNLIDLTPADHFFAHLLLARIYGGRLWLPVLLWCGGEKGNWRARKSRLNYAWASRAARKRVRGRGAWQFDPTVHNLEHRDGRTLDAVQFDIPSKIGGVASGVNLLLKGKIASYRGWYIRGRRPDHFGHGRPGNDHPYADRRIYKWVHVDGRAFAGTRFDFCQMSGVSKKSACLMVSGKQVISKGWTLHGAKVPTLGRATARDNYPLPRRKKLSVD